jgi:DNA-binding response OmpR family regulator
MQHPKDASENTTPHLLIVDDDVDLCEVLTRYLEAEDVRVSSAHTGS